MYAETYSRDISTDSRTYLLFKWMFTMTGVKGMHRPSIIPQDLPCGCKAASHENVGRNGVLILHDGTRVCKQHGKRYRLVFIEIKLGDE
jgi:hypothetical protein